MIIKLIMAEPSSQAQPGPSPHTESTNSFSEGYAERRLEARSPSSPGGSSEATNAFSEGEIESRTQARQSGAPGQTIFAEAAGHVQEVDLITVQQQLEWKYRVVILPDKAFDIDKVTATRGEWITTAGEAQCLAIAQTAEHASCEINLPIHIQLFFDPDSDSVRARNKGEVVIELDPICPPDTLDTPDKVSLQPYLTATITSGSWRVSADSDSFRILIFSRQYTLQLLSCRPAQEVVGSKRRRDVEDVAQDAGKTRIIRHLGSVTELSRGAKVLLDATTGSYQLVHLKKVADTRASKVFQARHSDHPDQVVIVKIMKRDTSLGPERYALSWEREYNLHRGLEHVCLPFSPGLFSSKSQRSHTSSNSSPATPASSR